MGAEKPDGELEPADRSATTLVDCPACAGDETLGCRWCVNGTMTSAQFVRWRNHRSGTMVKPGS